MQCSVLYRTALHGTVLLLFLRFFSLPSFLEPPLFLEESFQVDSIDVPCFRIAFRQMDTPAPSTGPYFFRRWSLLLSFFLPADNAADITTITNQSLVDRRFGSIDDTRHHNVSNHYRDRKVRTAHEYFSHRPPWRKDRVLSPVGVHGILEAFVAFVQPIPLTHHDVGLSRG